MKRITSNSLKKSIGITFVFLFFISLSFSQSQGGEWTWMSGDNGTPTGIYGTQGTPSTTNKPPGLTGAASWTDLTGKFWIYGGQNYIGTPQVPLQADLWMFDPATNEWTWLKGPGFVTSTVAPTYGTMGIAAPTNTPGTRAFTATWVDNAGDLWLFGGSSKGGSNNLHNLNDLWKYNIATNQWTWMKGTTNFDDTGSYGTLGVSNPSNNPACRQNGNATWTDNIGNLWMFGGEMHLGGTFSCGQTNSYALNDLWKYDIITNEWTWMHGSLPYTQDFGLRGTAGIPTASTRPSVRSTSHKWKDAAGNFWMFGGQGTYWFNESLPPNFGNYSCGYLSNEVWKYDISTNQWTFIGGTSQNDQNNAQESAGVSCTLAPTNHPAPRTEQGNGISWIDNCGNFWFYGGWYSSLGINLNRLWRYNYTTNEWSWSGNPSSTANFGTMGVSSPNNQPYSRSLGVGWTDASGNFWMGFGYNIDDGVGIYKNDVWKFTPDYCACVSCAVIDVNVTASDSTICGGSTTLTATGANNYMWSPATGLSSTSGASVTASPTVTTTYTVIGTIGNCLADTTTITITVNGQQSADFSYDGPFCQSDVNPFPILDPGSSAGTFTATPSGLVFDSGVSGEVDLSASAPGTYTITNTLAALGSCPQVSATATITVNAFQDASFSYSNGSYCQTTGNVLPTITGASGGSFSATPSGLIINSSTGEIDLSSPPNNYLVSYITSGTCGDTGTFTISINTGNSAGFSYSGPYCSNDTDPIPTLNPGSSAGTFTSTPAGLVFVSVATGEVDLSTSTPGTYTVTNVVAASGSCPQVSETATITIIASQDAAFAYTNASYCQSNGTSTPNISGTISGTFSASPAGLFIDSQTGAIDLSSPANTYTITYTTPGPCGANSSQVVEISNTFSIVANGDDICEGEVAFLTGVPTVSGGTFLWSPGGENTSSISVNPTTTTNYTVSYTLGGCMAMDFATVTVNSASASIITPNTIIGAGETIQLEGSGGGTYLWSTGQSGQIISVSPTESTSYCLIVTNNGCQDSACVTIEIGCESVLYAPNCITANGDKTNDEFIVQGDCLSEYHLMIFNRWGELIFETFEIADSWDGSYKGKPVSDGVYTYLIYARGDDNVYYDKHGFVTVLK